MEITKQNIKRENKIWRIKPGQLTARRKKWTQYVNKE